MMDIVETLGDKLSPTNATIALSAVQLGLAVLLGALGALWKPAWSVLKLITTLVHELAHGFVGQLLGRRFTALVVRSDMSGHAVTVGKPHGMQRIITTWVGYPAPGITAAVVSFAAVKGWSPATLAGLFVLCVLALTRVRSFVALVAVAAFGSVAGALWWWADVIVQAQFLVFLGVLLTFGAWRHLSAVMASKQSTNDAAVLANLTKIPAALWLGSFGLVIMGSTVTVLGAILTHL